MKFALFFAHQLPRPWSIEDEPRLFREALEQVELGDKLGIQYCWGQEHNFLEEYCHSSAPEVYLGAFSQRTKHMRIGHGIVHMPPNFNHPARVAERISTLDLVSNGRVEWGTGEAGTRMELEAFNVPYSEKRSMWAEAVRESARMMSMEPYPGYKGKYFEFPARNVVPKPIQKPHPPLWMACSNRMSLRYAARCGVGALTFAFMDATEAKFWVKEYYDTFANECNPIGRTVNPNVAMLTQFMCHKHESIAIDRGADGAQFFAYGLAHYYRHGTHVPGRTNLWEEFKSHPHVAMAGNLGLGTPEQIDAHFRAFEDAGVDQLILLQQAGKYRQEHICESLELFAKDVLPGFTERDASEQSQKNALLEPYIEKALSKIPKLDGDSPIPAVDSYPVLSKKLGVDTVEYHRDRSALSGAIWRLQMGGRRTPKSG